MQVMGRMELIPINRDLKRLTGETHNLQIQLKGYEFFALCTKITVLIITVRFATGAKHNNEPSCSMKWGKIS
jgi:hypothetical protein